MNAMNSPLCANYNSCTRVSPLCIPRMKYICIYSATTTRKNEKYFKKNKPNKLSLIKTNTKPAHNHESLAAAVSLRSKRSSRNEQMRSGLLKPEPEIIRANDILCKTEYQVGINNHIVRLVHKKYYTNMSDVPRSLQSWVLTIHTVVLTADVFQLFIKYFFLVFFCAPRCHLTDGCHLTHTGAIMPLNDYEESPSSPNILLNSPNTWRKNKTKHPVR